MHFVIPVAQLDTEELLVLSWSPPDIWKTKLNGTSSAKKPPGFGWKESNAEMIFGSRARYARVCVRERQAGR
jgi:hypothetical protein